MISCVKSLMVQSMEGKVLIINCIKIKIFFNKTNYKTFNLTLKSQEIFFAW